VRRWVFLAAALLAAGLLFATLYERACAPPPEGDIDAASQEALREVLRGEDE
jgi:hypothetical protein